MANLSRERAVLLLLATFFTLLSYGQNNCIIPLESQPDRYFPLIVSRLRGILFPMNSRSIVVYQGEIIDIVCPGSGNGLAVGQQPFVTTICFGPAFFLFANFQFKCISKVTENVTSTDRPCGSIENSTIVEIGWDVPYHTITSQIWVCFNQQQLTTEYAVHFLIGCSMRYKDTGAISRPSFKTDKYFSHLSPLMSTVYNNQLPTLASLLGSQSLADAYIRGWGPESYLARGHLAPDKDFSLVTMQDATYHYINAVPMWHAFNNGNWKDLEAYIRTASMRLNPRRLMVFTGTQGVLSLPDENNNLVDIYLWNGTDRMGVPVPQLIWKVVYDYEKMEGVAFVMVNHPYPSLPSYQLPDPPKLCTDDVCDRITWVYWNNRNDRNKGMIYCCTVDSLLSSGINIPVPANLKLME